MAWPPQKWEKSNPLSKFWVDKRCPLRYLFLMELNRMNAMHTRTGFFYYYFSRRAGMP